MENEVVQSVTPQTEAINTPTQDTTPVTDTTVAQTPKKSNKVLIIILACVLSFIGLIAVIFLIVNSATKEPLGISNQFLDAFTSQDAQTAYDFTSNQFQEVTTIEEFETFQNEYKDMNLNESKVIGKSISTTNSSTVATITYSKTYESEEYIFEIQLVKIGEEWKVQSFSFE